MNGMGGNFGGGFNPMMAGMGMGMGFPNMGGMGGRGGGMTLFALPIICWRDIPPNNLAEKKNKILIIINSLP